MQTWAIINGQNNSKNIIVINAHHKRKKNYNHTNCHMTSFGHLGKLDICHLQKSDINNLTPSFVNLKHCTKNKRTSNIFQASSIYMLRDHTIDKKLCYSPLTINLSIKILYLQDLRVQ